MSTWFRFYTSALNDPKVQRLPPALFKTWVNILCVASEENGSLPPVEELAVKLRLRPDRCQSAVSKLTVRRLLDVKDGDSVVHNWKARQFISDVSTQRVRDYRKRSKDASRNVSDAVSETPPDSDYRNREIKEGLRNGKEANGHHFRPLPVEPSVRKMDQPMNVWLKEGDTRIPRAQKWWLENYGFPLKMERTSGGKNGYHVPWAAVK